MKWFDSVAVVLGLVAAAALLGWVWRARSGRSRRASAPWPVPVLTPADVASTEPFGESATLLLFSTEFCSRCPATSALLGSIAQKHPGVTHLDVDLTHRADLANRFNILQTPTTFVLDASGGLRSRIGGPPRQEVVKEELDRILRSTRVRYDA